MPGLFGSAITNNAPVVASTKGGKQVTVAILPRPGLPPDDCQRLGHVITAALPELHASEDTQGNASAIVDLLAGEQPKPLVLCALAMYRELKKAFRERVGSIEVSDAVAAFKRHHANHAIAELCDVPAVFIIVPTEGTDRRDAVADRVRALLPQQLIREVRAIYPSMNR